MMSEKPVDTLEAGLRLGCGGVFGAAAGLGIYLETAENWWWLIPLFGLVLAVLALKFGDGLWHKLGSWFWW